MIDHSKCITCKKKLLHRYVVFDDTKYCLKCFYMSGKSLPIFHEDKRKHKRKSTN